MKQRSIVFLAGVFSLIFLMIVPSMGQSSRAKKPAKPQVLKGLFIGNSFTFFHGGVNNLTAAMVNTAPGFKLTTVSSVQGGYCLAQHSDPEDSVKTIQKLKSQKWNFVVLQEQSLFPIAQRDAMLEAGCKIEKEILASSPATQVLLYETWARGPGMSQGYGDDPQLKEEMLKFYNEKFGLRVQSGPVPGWLKNGIRGAYAELKEAIDKQVDQYNALPEHKIKAPYALIVPAGTYWEKAKQQQPSINLYHTDSYHQSPAGNYLTALIFYKTITGNNKVSGMYNRLIKNRINPGISATDAADLEKIAEQDL